MKNYNPNKTMILGVKQLALFIGLLLVSLYTSAQAPDFDWARQSQGNSKSTTKGMAIAHDNLGYSYVTGSFRSSATFGNGSASITLTNSGTLYTVFVVKYDANGVVQWAKKAEGTGSKEGLSIAVDGSGCYVTGYFEDKITFGSITLRKTGSPANRDVFVAKFDANGVVQWAKQAGGTNEDASYGIAVDGTNNSYVTGTFQGNATFGSTTLTSSGSGDVFVAKYDEDGNVLWAKKAGGISADRGNSIAIDNTGNSYVTGYFHGSATFGSTMLTNAGDRDVFVAKYDEDGNVLWAKQAGGTSIDFANGIAVDDSDNSYVTGYFQDYTTFGSTTLTSSGYNDVFVAKFDANGVVQWAKQAGGISSDHGNDIAVDGTGNSYITGNFIGSATFGSTTLTGGGNDVFVAKFDANGVVQWAKQAGGTQYDIANSIAVDGSSNSYITGSFMGSATFGSTILTTTGTEFFIAKLNAASSARYALLTAGSGINGNVHHIHDVNAYPNPFTDKLNIELGSDATAETAKVTLSSIDGKTLYQKEVKLTNGRVSEELNGLSKLPAGMYFLRLQLNEKPIVLKVLKQ